MATEGADEDEAKVNEEEVAGAQDDDALLSSVSQQHLNSLAASSRPLLALPRLLSAGQSLRSTALVPPQGLAR